MKHLLLLSAWCVGVCAGAAGQDAKKYPDPAPMTHDMSEFWTPQPKIVTPPDMDNAVVAPPSDAVVLLGLKDNAISEWVNCEEGKPVGWQIENGIMTVKPHSGSIRTKKDFGDFQLHLEWSAPTEIVGESQGRGNSGVFMQGMYEVQILDNYQNETYANGQAGSIYKQTPPLVNACQKPGKWNTYDLIYTAEQYDDSRNDRVYRFPADRRAQQGPDHLAGSFESGAFPQYLDPRTVIRRTYRQREADSGSLSLSLGIT